MSGHIERHYSCYSAEQLFDLVADVEKYPEFLPWILSCRIVARQAEVVWVDMVLGMGPLRQRFGTRALVHRPHSIDITSDDIPFESFHQKWEFSTDKQGRAVVAYSYDFCLRSHLLELISDAALDQAVQTTVDALERRAREVYGDRPLPAGGRLNG